MWGTYSTIQWRLSEASLKNPDETMSVFKQTYTQRTRVWADKFRDFSVAQDSLRRAKLRKQSCSLSLMVVLGVHINDKILPHPQTDIIYFNLILVLSFVLLFFQLVLLLGGGGGGQVGRSIEHRSSVHCFHHRLYVAAIFIHLNLVMCRGGEGLLVRRCSSVPI